MDYVTQKALAEALGITNAGVFVRARKMGIAPRTIRGQKSGRQNIYTIEQAKLLGYKTHQETNEHPLVTEKRWLKPNEWPETLPACFHDLEDD